MMKKSGVPQYIKFLKTFVLAGLLGGCGGGGGGESTEDSGSNPPASKFQAPSFDVLALQGPSETFVSIPASSAAGPHISLYAIPTGEPAGPIDFEFDDGRVFRVSADPNTGKVRNVFVRLAGGERIALIYDNYNDLAGTFEVSYAVYIGDSTTNGGPFVANRVAPTEISSLTEAPAKRVALPSLDLTGTWSVSEKTLENECSASVPQELDATYQIMHSDGLVEAVADSGEIYRGRLSERLTLEGARVTDSGRWERSLSAQVLEDGRKLRGIVDWELSVSNAAPGCVGQSHFEATMIGGYAMGQFASASASVDPLDQAIDEGLRVFSDPFETYLPLNIYKTIGEEVAEIGDRLLNTAETVQSRFFEARKLVSDAVDSGGQGIRKLGHRLRCAETNVFSSCAREVGQRAVVLSEEIFRLNRPDIDEPFFASDERFIQPAARAWRSRFEDGSLTTDELRKTNIEPECVSSILASMNPSCPQFDDPLTWSEPDIGPGLGDYQGSGSTFYEYDPGQYNYSDPTDGSDYISSCPPDATACSR